MRTFDTISNSVDWLYLLNSSIMQSYKLQVIIIMYHRSKPWLIYIHDKAVGSTCCIESWTINFYNKHPLKFLKS